MNIMIKQQYYAALLADLLVSNTDFALRGVAYVDQIVLVSTKFVNFKLLCLPPKVVE